MNLTMTSAGSPLRILYIAYPLLPVSEHSAGGAEQMLWTLEREMHACGFKTTVAACAGSQVAGALFETGDQAEMVDQFEVRSQQQTRTVVEWLRSGAETQFDLLHDMSGGFWQHARDIRLPVVATLHLPRSLYKQVNFSEVPSNVVFNCVSQRQTSDFEDIAARVIGVARNGIALDRFPPEPVGQEQREYLLWLGRICEEKGTHTALDVAHAAGKKLVIAGMVYPFLYHQKYFAREIIPRLKRAGSMAKYIERPTFAEKIDLIRNAKALLISSNISETSSIVAMEAAACGTPVVALRQGALPEVIADGTTGILAQDANEMVEAISRIDQITGKNCRRYAEQHYSSAGMADKYEQLYRLVLKMAAEETPTTRS
jgi:glycosyltransferase involved in cell wall biosynthesis